MKKSLLIFAALVSIWPDWAMGALKVTKSSSVAPKSKSVTESTGSMVPTVLNLVGAVQALNTKTKELTAECVPTSSDVEFVNNTVKEWAKTGAYTADEVEKKLGRRRCSSGPTGGYARSVEMTASTDDEVVCFDYFGGAGNTGMVWENFPMAAIATYCTDGSEDCGSSKKKTVSNLYDIFNLIDFGEKDYTRKEAETAGKILAKVEKCSDSKLSATKRAMWGEFLVNTISGVGEPTNTGAIMQSVGNISGSGLGGLSSLSGLATQLLDK